MYRRALIRLSVACVTVMASFILVSVAVAAQPTQQPPPSSPTQVLIYDPYPLGILPADLESEIERVRREVQGIFNQALLQSRRREHVSLHESGLRFLPHAVRRI